MHQSEHEQTEQNDNPVIAYLRKYWEHAAEAAKQQDTNIGEVIAIELNMRPGLVHTLIHNYCRDGTLVMDHIAGTLKVNEVPDMEVTVADRIAHECDSLKQLLLHKNHSYGNSALEPLRIFSRTDTVEQLKVRLDDKLSRIARGSEFNDEDTLQDIMGYLILLRIAKSMEDKP